MMEDEIRELIEQGENRGVEFKSARVRPEALAREMVAFSNSLGGLILIGVEDDGEVAGLEEGRDMETWVANIARNNVVPGIVPLVEFCRMSGKKVAVVRIPKGQFKPYQTIDGKYWIRVGSTNRTATKEELSRLFQQSGLFHFDISPVEGSSLKDLQFDKLDDYWTKYYQIPFLELETQERIDLLANADILVPCGSTSVEGEEDGRLLLPSVGGLLIFGKYPQRRLPQSEIVLAVFGGDKITDELIDKKNLTGPLSDLIDNAGSLVRLFTPVSSTVEGMKRKENIVFPAHVVREAMVNAVCHRDYSIGARKTTVYIFSDRVEVTSPGKIPNTLTLEKIKTGNSSARNHLLLKFLDNMRYVDGLGRGIPMIIREMKERVDFEEIGELFRVTLFRKSP